ncbi:MAG: helix-turn-helix domain-containing protein [Chloroflexia bacterium]|nr:helix-turn-helix domain-containing protein [Chloroflexia bacterium]
MTTMSDIDAALAPILDVLRGIFDTLQRLANRLESKTSHLHDRPGPLLLAFPEAAEFLGLTERTLRHLVHERRMPLTRIGRRIYFQADELTRWIDEQTENAASAE